jgi:hypothetical protein
MVTKDRRNNFFLFENKDKTQGYMSELGSKTIMTTSLAIALEMLIGIS